jgi:hypothetical protein
MSYIKDTGPGRSPGEFLAPFFAREQVLSTGQRQGSEKSASHQRRSGALRCGAGAEGNRDMVIEQTWSGVARAVSRCEIVLGLLVSSPCSGVWFCLLCFQPEPVPRSLPARSPQPPPKRPSQPAGLIEGSPSHTLPTFHRFTTLRHQGLTAQRHRGPHFRTAALKTLENFTWPAGC